MELNVFSTIIRMFLIVGVPVTGCIVGFGLLGYLLTGFFSIQDYTLNYALRVIGALFALILLGAPMINFFIEETRTLYLLVG